MREEVLKVISNEPIAKDTYKMVLCGAAEKQKAGQFVEIKLDGFTLRRPFCVADQDGDRISVVYKVLGAGTRAMTEIKEGEELNTLTSLGNGFNLTLCDRPLLIGGGLGIAPLLYLAKELKRQGKSIDIILGAKNKDELILIDEFSKFCNVYPATDDGSLGFKGNTVALALTVEGDYDGYYACGPEIMLKNLSKLSIDGEISMEARMGCGFGACMGCSIKTTGGYKRVCKEGPVFMRSEVLYE
ncbi:MAG: dihydroorotate dehydrogenase electron transfer subunit [Clostridiales bacterium]|nr:dihydroorotate dehydrogenase electron transfer subunit [Clostridiales bacterium]